jgi:hypothetical protein
VTNQFFAASQIQADSIGSYWLSVHGVNNQPDECQAFYSLFPDSLQASNWILVNLCMGSDSLSQDSLVYQWTWGDSLNSTSSVAFPSFTYTSPGFYTICVTITDTITGCTRTYCDSSVYISKSMANQMIHIQVVPYNYFQLAAIHKTTSEATSVDVFPNPAHQVIELSFRSGISSNYSFQLLDMFGRMVKAEHIFSAHASINIEDIPAGLYTLVLSDGINYSRRKITVN